MTDIHCAICNEPWDSYGLINGDVKAWEADNIKNGYGCPCCKTKGFEPAELYGITSPELIGHCHICLVGLEIDKNRYEYRKGIKTLIDPDTSDLYALVDDKFCCLACYAELTTCDICGKWVNKENTFYDQNKNEERCEDCMDDVTTCTNCQESDESSKMRFVDSKPYCSSCYGPDMEIQNESD
jgi:hypothetical protein